MIATAPSDILRFALDRSDEGLATVLVTLTGIHGTSPRALGAQMAVAADGRYAGSFSGGCIEAAVVAEAIGTLADGRAKLVRFGAGSPYLDIRLPCGGGIDLLFNAHPDRSAIAHALSRLDRRASAALHLSMDGVQPADATGEVSPIGWKQDRFLLRLAPSLRIVAIGQGEELTALARLAHAFGADVHALSPDRERLDDLARQGIDTTELATRTALPPTLSDPWTAILFLFHDRDWEEHLLPAALELPGFYFGAVGSQRTQEIRLEALRAAGIPDQLRQLLRTSVGLIPATRDPATLALSALSQIVQEYHRIGDASRAAQEDGTDPLHGDGPANDRERPNWFGASSTK